MEFSLLEQQYIDDTHRIGKEKGDSLELSKLCRKAYEDYRQGVISSYDYDYVYGICCQYTYQR